MEQNAPGVEGGTSDMAWTPVHLWQKHRQHGEKLFATGQAQDGSLLYKDGVADS